MRLRVQCPWSPIPQVDAEAVVCLARALGPLKGTDEEPLGEPLDEALVRIVALSSAGSLSPMAAILGAVAAQHVVKVGTGREMGGCGKLGSSRCARRHSAPDSGSGGWV